MVTGVVFLRPESISERPSVRVKKSCLPRGEVTIVFPKDKRVEGVVGADNVFQPDQDEHDQVFLVHIEQETLNGDFIVYPDETVLCCGVEGQELRPIGNATQKIFGDWKV